MTNTEQHLLVSDELCTESVNSYRDLMEWVQSFLCDDEASECRIVKPEGFNKHEFFS